MGLKEATEISLLRHISFRDGGAKGRGRDLDVFTAWSACSCDQAQCGTNPFLQDRWERLAYDYAEASCKSLVY